MVFYLRLLPPCTLPSPQLRRWKLHSKVLQPKTQETLSPQRTARVLSSWEEQDFSISYSVPRCLMLRLSPIRFQTRSEDSFLLFNLCSLKGRLYLRHSTTESTGALIVLSRLLKEWFQTKTGKLRGPQASMTSSLSSWMGVSLRERLAIVPTPNFRALAQRFCMELGGGNNP